MNLACKYIEINRNNSKDIITLLYKKGYSWLSGYDLGLTLHQYKMYINDDGKTYISFYNPKSFCFNKYIDSVEEEYTFFDINILMREDKLKRILKTK